MPALNLNVKEFQGYGYSKFSFLRIAKFALGVRQFIAAFNDGIYSVPQVR
jgi:hypothetical protein